MLILPFFNPDFKKTKNADRSPYATENDRRMKLKGLSRILRNPGVALPACLLKNI